jgi:hypothetical protein
MLCFDASTMGQSNVFSFSGVNRHPNEALHERLTESVIVKEVVANIAFLDEEREKQRILGFYSKLDLSFLVQSSTKLTRPLIVLMVAGLVFFVVSALYVFQVIPSFLDAMGSGLLPEAEMLMGIQQNWPFYFGGVFVLLLWVIFIAGLTHKVSCLSVSSKYYWLLKCSLLPDIGRHYFRLQALMWAPFSLVTLPKELHEGTSLEHLSRLQASSVDITEELQSLIDQQVRLLNEQCQLQLKGLMTLIASLMIGAVCFFLLGAFSPLVSTV